MQGYHCVCSIQVEDNKVHVYQDNDQTAVMSTQGMGGVMLSTIGEGMKVSVGCQRILLVERDLKSS